MQEIDYCFECTEFPCKRIKRLEKSYNTRYHASLLENSKAVKTRGMSVFLKEQREKYTCPKCGGIISIHDAECSECQHKVR